MTDPVPAIREPDLAIQAGGATSAARTGPSTRLNGPRLLAARVAWLALTALSIALFALDLPVYIAAIHGVCSRAICPSVQVSPAGAQALARLGISLDSYAAFVTADTLVVVLIFCAVAAVLAWRRSDDWLALLVAYMLVGLGTDTVSSSLAVPNGVWSFLDGLASYLSAAVALYLVFYLFPRGRFSPRWLGWATLVVIGVDAGNSLFPGSALDVDRWVPNLENLFFFGLLAALAGAQVYRYIRVYNPIEQQQSKWVIFSVAIFAAFGLAVFVLAPLLVGTMFLSTSLLGVIGPFAFVDIFALLFPISFAIAIFRYRLWDIDLIINRALVYGSLSLLLAGVYVGAVIGLQVLAEAVTGQHSTQPVAIVASTLLIAALFEPLRRRLQTAIDRRFYRSKYDAARTLATFSATLRGELDLHELTERLQVVVSETMQPAHVSLWLMPSRRSAVEEGQEA